MKWTVGCGSLRTVSNGFERFKSASDLLFAIVNRSCRPGWKVTLPQSQEAVAEDLAWVRPWAGENGPSGQTPFPTAARHAEHQGAYQAGSGERPLEGRWLDGSGPVWLSMISAGFNSVTQRFNYDMWQPWFMVTNTVSEVNTHRSLQGSTLRVRSFFLLKFKICQVTFLYTPSLIIDNFKFKWRTYLSIWSSLYSSSFTHY